MRYCAGCRAKKRRVVKSIVTSHCWRFAAGIGEMQAAFVLLLLSVYFGHFSRPCSANGTSAYRGFALLAFLGRVCADQSHHR